MTQLIRPSFHCVTISTAHDAFIDLLLGLGNTFRARDIAFFIALNVVKMEG